MRARQRDRTIHWIYGHYDPRITYVCNNPITGLYVIRLAHGARHFISCLLCHFYDDRDILLRIIRRGILREIICQVTSKPKDIPHPLLLSPWWLLIPHSLLYTSSIVAVYRHFYLVVKLLNLIFIFIS